MPTKTNYAVAVTGIKDASATSLPVRLKVNSQKEPSIPGGKAPSLLTGTVTVSGLTPGVAYTLLRFDTSASVPTTGNAAAFLAAPWGSSVKFTATAATWTYTDPKKIPSNGVAYYRAVRNP